MSKHTPGPWELCFVDSPTEIWYEDGFYMAGPAVIGSEYSKLTEQDKADACLIAAAPDLLEALQELLNLDEELSDQKAACAIDKARAAIAKATGETK